MKKLPLNTPQYKQLEQSFRDWLETLGYSESAQEKYPVLIRELLHALEQNDRSLTAEDIEQFYKRWQDRENRRKGGSLSKAYINQMANALHCFTRYLNATRAETMTVHLPRPERSETKRQVLTRGEIRQLYQACRTDHPYGLRDRAMLAVYYGCGLRKKEGNDLNIEDIDPEDRKIHVREGKGGKERWVPMSARSSRDIETYLWEGRPWFFYHHSVYLDTYHYNQKEKADTDREAFFLNGKGQRMYDFTWRLRKLKRRAGIEKRITLHVLRHSIATHLLQDGMDIEYIAQFLGHSSLESTQIYTHIVHQTETR